MGLKAKQVQEPEKPNLPLGRRPWRRSTRGAAGALAVLAASMAMAPAASAATRVWAVGDGGVEGPADDALASRVAREGLDRLLYLGDVYETGTAREYATNYATSWGRFKRITRPTPGNHEWDNRKEGYDPYWGSRAPRNGGGHYYSFNLDGWHFVSLNSHEDSGPDSPQAAWLARDLKSYPGTCTIAFDHRPRYSAGGHGDAADLEPLYSRLSGSSVALLSGHEHNYQRLRPQRGITQFIVGSGGRELSELDISDPRLTAFDYRSHGALELVIRRGRADYRFVRTDGSRRDAGSLPCRPHARRPRVRILSPGSGGPYGTLRSVSGRSGGARGPIRLTVVREVDGRCRVFDGRRFRRASCRTRRGVGAVGVRRWRRRLPRALARGRYRVTARATGAVDQRASSTVRFTVR